MTSVNTFGIQFIFRLDKLKNGKAPIYVRITVNGEISHFAIKQSVNPEQWDNRRGIDKGKGEAVKDINYGLEQIRVALSSTTGT